MVPHPPVVRAVTMSRALGALLALVLIAAAPAPESGKAAPGAALTGQEARLDQLFADDARREEQLNPLERLYRGELPDPLEFRRLFTDELDEWQTAGRR